MPQTVAEELAEHLRQYPAADDGLVFHTREGRPYHYSYYGHSILKPAVLRAGLLDQTSSHDLYGTPTRRGCWLPASLVAVAERLGHDDGKLVLSTYGHLMPDSEDRTRSAIDTAFRTAGSASAESPASQGRPR